MLRIEDQIEDITLERPRRGILRCIYSFLYLPFNALGCEDEKLIPEEDHIIYNASESFTKYLLLYNRSVDLICMTGCEEIVWRVRYTGDWSRVYFPKSLKRLELDLSNFCGDLTYLPRLEVISLRGVHVKRWGRVRFPASLRILDASGSNFKMDIH